MGFFQDLGRTFGLVKPIKPEIKRFEGIRPFGSLKEIPEQEEYLKTLRERIAGRGVGFREQELSAATSPFAAQRRAGLKEQTIPQISAQASARGLGRSTIPVSRIGLASGEAERDIGEKIANIRLANELQRRQEINAALGKFGEFPQQEAAVKMGRAAFDIGEFRRVEEATRADHIRREAETQEGIRRMLAVMASFGDKIIGTKTQSSFEGGGVGQTGGGAQVNTGGSGANAAQIAQLLAIFGKCWVAAEIFAGWSDPKTIAVRNYITNFAPRWFDRFYTKNGENIAKFIHNKPILKALLRPIFEVFALMGKYRRVSWQVNLHKNN